MSQTYASLPPLNNKKNQHPIFNMTSNATTKNRIFWPTNKKINITAEISKQLGILPTELSKYAVTTVIIDGKKSTIIIYPAVSPESIVIPIVSCILGFPLLALLIICCLRRRAKLARERDRRRNYDIEGTNVSMVRFSPVHRLTENRWGKPITLQSERSMSTGGFPSLELDTVLEERISDAEQTQTDVVSPDSPAAGKNGNKNFVYS